MTMPAEGQGEPVQPDPVAPVEPIADVPYAKELEQFPESIRPIAEKTFKQWDQQVSEKFQTLHQEYEPWKAIRESYEPDVVNQSLLMAQAMEENPQGFLEAVAQAYGIDLRQGQGTPQPPVNSEPVDPDAPVDPYADRFSGLENTVTQLATIIVNERQIAEANSAQGQLDAALNDLRGPNGENKFDEDYVVGLIAQGYAPQQALERYNSAIEAAIAAKGAVIPAPTVVSGSGGTPSLGDGIRPSQMSDKQTQAHVAELLRQAHEASQ